MRISWGFDWFHMASLFENKYCQAIICYVHLGGICHQSIRYYVLVIHLKKLTLRYWILAKMFTKSAIRDMGFWINISSNLQLWDIDLWSNISSNLHPSGQISHKVHNNEILDSFNQSINQSNKQIQSKKQIKLIN